MGTHEITSDRDSLVYTVPEVARLLHSSPSTLYHQIKAGTAPFPIVRIGKTVRVPKVLVHRLLDETDTLEQPRTASAAPDPEAQPWRCA